MLNSRQYLIVDLLAKTSTPIAVDEIAKIACKSKRTIMRDLSSIKLILESQGFGELQNIDSVGYKVNIDDFDAYEEFMKESINDEEIIFYELIQNDYVTVETLCDILYISKITCAEKLNVMKENYRSIITIASGKKGHYLEEGLVKQCILLSNLISNDIKKYLTKLNINYEQYEKLEMLIDHDNNIKEYFPNVSANQITDLFIASILFDKKEYNAENESFSELLDLCGIAYTKNAIGILAAISDYCIDINLNLTMKKIKDVLYILEEQNAISFDEQLASQLYHHLKRMLCYPYFLKIKEIHNISNIKASYPFSFDLSISFIKLMDKIYGYKIANQDLIGLYFAVNLEKNKKQINKIIIYSKDNAISNINKQLLEDSLFNCEVEISSDMDYVNESDALLIINGSPHKNLFTKEEFHIHYILSEKDIVSIQEKLDYISVSRSMDEIFLKSESFTYEVKDNETIFDVLENVCQRLLNHHVITYDEFNSIIEREKQGNSLIIDNYLIPHCISKKDNFCISIYVHLDKSLLIDDRVINHMLVTLMSPKLQGNMNIFKSLYRYLNSYSDSLSTAKSYDDFVHYLSEERLCIKK